MSFSLDDNKNIIDKTGNVIYFYRYNFFDDDFNLNIDKNNYSINSKGDLSINKSLFNTSHKKLDLVDLYEINNNKNLQTYSLGFLNIPSDSFVERKDYIIIDHSYLSKHRNFFTINDDMLTISKDYYSYDENAVIQPESSAVVLDNNTGYVKAIVGGLDINTKNSKILNRATSSPRAPGSLISPLSVYLPSLENGKTLGSVVDDVPILDNKEIYPYNFYDGFKGLLTMRYSIDYGSSTGAVKFLKKLGFNESIKSLTKLGIVNENPSLDNFVSIKENVNHNDENIDSLALGNMQRGITNIEAASAYRAIANGGNYKKVSSVIKIEDSTGITIIDNKKPDRENIFREENCYLLTDALRTNVTRGTAKGASIYNFDIAGTIGKNKFNSPDNIIEKYICQKSGNLGTLLCEEANDGYVEKFIKGTEPKNYCKGHKKALICNVSNRLAGEYCPKEDVEYRIIYDRSDYNPKEHNNIYPDDYEFMPKYYCNVHDEEWYNKQKNPAKNSKTKNIKSSKDSSKKTKKKGQNQ